MLRSYCGCSIFFAVINHAQNQAQLFSDTSVIDEHSSFKIIKNKLTFDSLKLFNSVSHETFWID